MEATDFQTCSRQEEGYEVSVSTITQINLTEFGRVLELSLNVHLDDHLEKVKI